MQSLSQILVVQPGALLLLPDGEAGRLYGVMEAGLGTGYRTLGAIHTGFSWARQAPERTLVRLAVPTNTNDKYPIGVALRSCTRNASVLAQALPQVNWSLRTLLEAPGCWLRADASWRRPAVRHGSVPWAEAHTSIMYRLRDARGTHRRTPGLDAKREIPSGQARPPCHSASCVLPVFLSLTKRLL